MREPDRRPGRWMRPTGHKTGQFLITGINDHSQKQRLTEHRKRTIKRTSESMAGGDYRGLAALGSDFLTRSSCASVSASYGLANALPVDLQPSRFLGLLGETLDAFLGSGRPVGLLIFCSAQRESHERCRCQCCWRPRMRMIRRSDCRSMKKMICSACSWRFKSARTLSAVRPMPGEAASSAQALLIPEM